MSDNDTARAERAFQEAIALHRAGQLGPAIDAYKGVVALKPDFVGALCNLGVAFKQAGRLNDAIAAYRRALDIAPNLADVSFNLGIVLDRVGHYGKAIEAYRRAAEIKPDFAPAYANLGNALKKFGQPEPAVDAYRQALAIKPDHIGVLANVAVVLNELGRHEEALDACHQALEVDRSHVSALSQLSIALSALSRHEEAATVAGQALDREPDNVEALESLAAALKVLGRDEDLVAAYRKACAQNPGSADVHMSLAALYLERDNPASALAVCDEFLAHSPGNAWALAMKTTVLNELGDLDQLSYLADFDGLILKRQWDAAPGFDDLGRFNAALADHVLGHPSLTFQPGSQATRLGRHSGNLMVEPLGPISGLEQMICAAVGEYDNQVRLDPAHPFLANVPARWRLHVWAVVLEGQGYQVPHIHPSAWLSGVYYAKVPASFAASGGDQAGWIEFGSPFLRHKTKAQPRVRVFRPAEGLMLLFPSYFLHRTLPFESDDTRISIAFDVVPVDVTETASQT